jgi:hypothetical protein
MNQHWITRAYLVGWIDPTAPSDQEGYVWVFNKDGNNAKRKAPKNIFSEPDFYTQKTDDGLRDLTLETNLCRIEYDFIRLRRNKLESFHDLSIKDISEIILFASTMMHRTKLRRNKEKKHWDYVLEVMDDMAEKIKINPIKPISQFQPSMFQGSLSHGEVKKIAQEPIQNALPVAAKVTAEILAQMNIHILCTENTPGFITSDNPCIMFDPLYSSEYLGLGCPSIEVTLPISPKQLIIFFWGDRTQPCEYAYTLVKDEVVDDLNRRTRFFSEEYFVVNKNTKKDFWLK